MTTRLALALFALILGAITIDLAAGTGVALATARRLFAAIEALAIWR